MPKISIAHTKERLSILEKNIHLLEIQVEKTIDELTPAFAELRDIKDHTPSQLASLSEIDGLLGYATSVKFKLRKCREELRKAFGDKKETL